ncbi:MAG: efflux RND transporter permease subunit, partial [Rickettsiales bacterium]
MLDRFLNRPWRFALGMTALLVGIYIIYGLFNSGLQFFPEVEPQNAIVTVRSQPNLSVDERDALVKQVEARLMDMKEVRVLYSRAGTAGYGADEIGSIQLEFVDWDKRRPADDILQEIREKTADIRGITVETTKHSGGPPKSADVQIELRSRFPYLLDPTVDGILKKMRSFPGLVEIRDDRALREIEWQLDVDRELAGQYGLDVSTIGNFIKLVTNGVKASEYRPDDVIDEVEIIVRFPPKNRTISQLDRLKIYTEDGPVPIGNFVKRSARPRVGQIKRVDGMQVVNVTANVAPGYLTNDIVNALRQARDEMAIDPNVQIRFRGESEEQAKASNFLASAFMIAIFAM